MKNSRLILAALPILLATATANNSFAQSAPAASSLNIAAVVGDQVISSFDLNNRIKFILATTRLSNTPDTIAKIRPQIIRTLIDESLQMQEAERNNITIDDQEVAQAIANIEQQRQMPDGEIARMLKAGNIPEKTFNDQIRAQLAWAKVMTRFVRPRIKISDAEASLVGKDIATPEPSNITIKEVEISVINLAIDKPSRVAEVKKLGDKLYSELQKGANFREIARQFSTSGEATPFWIAPEQLDPNIVQVLKRSKEGTVTPPIQTGNGLSIIKLHNIRASENKTKEKKTVKDNAKDFSISLKEILLKLKPTATKQETEILIQIGAEVAKNPGSCEDKTVADVSELDSFDIEVNLRETTLSELSPALRGVSENLKIGEVSTPFASVEGIRMYMLCGKKEIIGKPINNEKIKEVLFRQKYELEAQKYLRDLQRNAFIEVRQ